MRRTPFHVYGSSDRSMRSKLTMHKTHVPMVLWLPFHAMWCCCFPSIFFYSVIFVWQRLLLAVLTAIHQYRWIYRKLYIEPDTFEPRTYMYVLIVETRPHRFIRLTKLRKWKCACLSKHRNFFNVKWYWIRTLHTVIYYHWKFFP